jgi:hypothetical protein
MNCSFQQNSRKTQFCPLQNPDREEGLSNPLNYDAVENGWTRFVLTDFGFDFTIEDLIDHLAITKAKIKHDKYPEVTSKLYITEVRAEFEALFGKK